MLPVPHPPVRAGHQQPHCVCGPGTPQQAVPNEEGTCRLGLIILVLAVVILVVRIRDHLLLGGLEEQLLDLTKGLNCEGVSFIDSSSCMSYCMLLI